MPYKRSYKKSYVKPGYVSCGKMVLSDAQKALAMAKYVKGLVNVEFKELDLARTTTAVTSGVIITSPSLVAQGDTKSSRSGNSIRLKSIQWKAIFKIDASAVATYCRCMIVLDRQVNGATFAIGDLVEDASISDFMVSPRDTDNANRFSILWDRLVPLNISGNQTASFSMRKKLNYVVNFDGTTAAVTDLTSNGIFLVIASDEATNAPLITDFCRIRFVDN